MIPSYNNNSFKDIPDLLESDFGSDTNNLMNKLNKLIYYFNYLTKSISLSKNFSYNSSIVNITIEAGNDLVITHLLGVTPKYRIILRQEGNGVLSDIPLSWNDKTATIRNNGAAVVTATIMFLKE